MLGAHFQCLGLSEWAIERPKRRRRGPTLAEEQHGWRRNSVWETKDGTNCAQCKAVFQHFLAARRKTVAHFSKANRRLIQAHSASSFPMPKGETLCHFWIWSELSQSTFFHRFAPTFGPHSCQEVSRRYQIRQIRQICSLLFATSKKADELRSSLRKRPSGQTATKLRE